MVKPVQTKLKNLYVNTSQGHAGVLTRESQMVFGYRTENPLCEISLTQPLSAQTYAANILPGVLRQNLPEGYLRSWIIERFGKTMKMDDFNMLALTGADMIGRVSVNIEEDAKPHAEKESLSSLLSWQGSEDLFDHLAEKYAQVSGVSGVQPKVLLRAHAEGDTVEKSAIKDRNLIIKAGGPEYEGLAENEYHCMSIGKAAGLEVPNFWLSDNRNLFIIERFDINPEDGTYLGFEDFTSLMGKQNEAKYQSSYENVAKAIDIYASNTHKSSSLQAFFESLVLSVTLRNGDAHLKNFGMLYTTPRSEDVRLSPLYDIVTTTAFIPKDVIALKLADKKTWPTRAELVEFGKVHCRLDRPAEIIDRIVDAADNYKPDIESSEMWTKQKGIIDRAVFTLRDPEKLASRVGVAEADEPDEPAEVMR